MVLVFGLNIFAWWVFRVSLWRGNGSGLCEGNEKKNIFGDQKGILGYRFLDDIKLVPFSFSVQS